jgi:GxxExxY protein
VEILYRGQKVGEHRLDLLIENKVVVENKAVLALDKVFFSVVRSYLKASNLRDALLLNFAAMPLTIKRVGPEDAQRYLDNEQAIF